MLIPFLKTTNLDYSADMRMGTIEIRRRRMIYF